MCTRLTALLLASFAFASAAAPPKPTVVSKAKPDSQIEQIARAKFSASKINEEKFTVRVQNGVAIIEGSTNVIQRKGVASRLAKLAGATSIDNRIRVSEEARRLASQRLAEGRKKSAAKKAARAEIARTMPAAAKIQTAKIQTATSKPVPKPVGIPAKVTPKTVVAPAPVATIHRAQIKH